MQSGTSLSHIHVLCVERHVDPKQGMGKNNIIREYALIFIFYTWRGNMFHFTEKYDGMWYTYSFYDN